MVSRRQQQHNILASRIASQGIAMVFPCTSCERLSKKCIVNPKNGNYSECARYGHQCDVDRSVVLQQIDAEQLKLLTEAQKAEAKVSKLLLQASEASSRARRLRKQVDFLEGQTRKIVKSELDSLEALHRAGANLSEDLSSPPTIVSPFPSHQ
jgi:peptidoglycan hydrolase CwlO-like protein